MINRQNRFHGHNSLSFVYKNGQVVRSDFISLKFVSSKRDDYRLAVVVSKKVNKKAVIRNRIRRRIYEVIRKIRKESVNSWQYDMVITVFDDRLAEIPSTVLSQQIINLLKKSKII